MIIVAPDLAVAARDCIRDGLAALGVPAQPVSTNVPNPRPSRFIKFEVLGGGKNNQRIARHTVVALVHDKIANEVVCGRVARQVAAVLEAAPDVIDEVNLGLTESVVRSDDPAVAGECRYQVTVSWTVAYSTA